MGKILCPTRGGEASFRTQDAAIAQAIQEHKALIFVYVVDTHFLDRTHRPVRPDVIAQEMAHMGEFLLTMAQERAEKRGVPVETQVRHGELREELVAAVKEANADLVILGRPVGKESAFEMAGLQDLAAGIEEETGAKTRIV
jgi:nucleotide-binding universal stress UspA family protein